MKRASYVAAQVAAATVLLLAACNNVGSCPSKVVPGASCSGDNLECPYDLKAPACEIGEVEGGATRTSCVCSNGTWSCPTADTCEAGAGDAAAEASGGDASADGGMDATVGDASDSAADSSSDGPAAEDATDASTEDGGSDSSVKDGSADASGG